jgi:hypothetical protein
MNSSIRYNKKTLLHKALSSVLMFVVVIQSVGIVPLEVFADEILSSEPAPIVESVVTEEVVPSETVSTEDAVVTEVAEEGSVVLTEPIASEEAPVTEEEVVVTEQVETQVVQEESTVSAVSETPSVSYSTFAGSCPAGKDCEMFVKSPGSILDPGEGVGYRAVCSSSAQICREQGYEDVICDPGYWTKSSWSSPVDNFQKDYSAGQWVTYGASSGDKEYWSSITCQRNSTVIDVCANLPDVQATIPSGYEFNINGACVLSSSGSPTPSYRGTAPEGLVFIETFENVYAGQSIRLLGSYSDVDGNLYKATIRDLGISDDKEGDLGVYPAIGESGEIIAGEVSAIERIFTIPVGVSGRYWFRTEVVDTEGNSDVMWNSLQVYPAQNGSGPICPTSYPDETVTARLNGGPVWGTYQYTADSDVSVAVVHQGILTPGQSATIRKTPIGFFSGYMGTTQYGVTSLSYTAWCGVSLSIVPGTLVDAPTTPTNVPPQATLTVTPSNPRAGDVVTITGTYSDAGVVKAYCSSLALIYLGIPHIYSSIPYGSGH